MDGVYRQGVIAAVAVVTVGCTFDHGGLTASRRTEDDATGMLQFADGGALDAPVGLDLWPAADSKPLLDQAPPLDLGAVDFMFPDLGSPPCGPATCNGCCQGSACLPGTAQDECGSAGAPCQDCDQSGQLCIAGACQGCSHSSQCPGDAVCLKEPYNAATGSCEPPWDRPWHVQVVDAEVNCSKDWEGSTSNKPDVYTLLVLGSKSYKTATKYDTCVPVWNQYIEKGLSQSTKVEFVVLDYDSYNADDEIGKVSYPSGLPVSVLKAGEISYQATGPGDGLLALKILLWPLP